MTLNPAQHKTKMVIVLAVGLGFILVAGIALYWLSLTNRQVVDSFIPASITTTFAPPAPEPTIDQTEEYKPSAALPILAYLEPVTNSDGEYALVITGAQPPAKALTVVVRSSAPVFQQTSSENIFTNRGMTEWTALYNKQTTDNAGSNARIGLINLSQQGGSIPSGSPVLLIRTDSPLTEDSLEANVEIITGDETKIQGRIGLKSTESDTTTSTNTNND